MIGAELTRQLLEDNNYTEVVSFVRRASGVKHPKLTEQIVDFDKRGRAHRMRHRAGIFRELPAAQAAHFADAGD